MNNQPPKLPLRFLRWFCRPELLKYIEGDLIELYDDHLMQKDSMRANWIFTLEVVKLFRPGIIRPFGRQHSFVTTVFLGSMMRASYRRLLREKHYALTNLFGLLIGFLVFLCTWMYADYERSFDEFLPNHEEVYRFEENWNRYGVEEKWCGIKGRIAPYVNTNFPGVTSTRLFQNPRTEVQFEDKIIDSDKSFYIDSTFMKVFHYPVVEGDADKMMNDLGSVILTESMAKKLFGEKPALHQSVIIKRDSYQVTGVLQDPPAHTHLHFDFLMLSRRLYDMSDHSLNDNMFYNYARIPAYRKEFLIQTLNENLDQMQGYDADLSIEGNSCYISTLPIHKIHLHGDAERELEKNGSVWVVNVIEMIGWFILLMSCVNYVNLATSRSMGRMAEVGIRKLHGSSRKMIALQFLMESVSLCFISAMLAIGVAYYSIPAFNDFFDLGVPQDYALLLELISNGLILTAIVGVLAGAYPAGSMVGVSVMSVLRSIGANKGAGRVGVRRGFITFQLMISVFTIMSTIVIFSQLQFMQNKNLGFDKSKLMVVALNPYDHYKEILRLKESMNGLAGITNVTASMTYPGRRYPFFTYRFPNLNKLGKVNSTLEDGSIWMRSVFGDEEMAETFGLELVEGRLVSKIAEDNYPDEFIINEAAVKFLNLENPIGETVDFTHGNDSARSGSIVGVVKDYNYASLHHAVEPMIMSATGAGWAKQFLLISFDAKAGDVASILEDHWSQYMGNAPLNYSFLDDQYKELYKNEDHLKVFLIILAVVSIVISILGLLGMSFFAMEQRKHEIGIRKVLGASVLSIVGLTTREYMMMTLGAVVVVVPLTYLLVNQWLEGFAYSIGVGPGIVLSTVGFVMMLVLSSVGYNVMSSALKNPVQMINKG